MKFSLAAQFLSPAFSAIVASSSSMSVAEALAKTKSYDSRNQDIHHAAAAAAAAAASRSGAGASRNLDSIHTTSTSTSSKSSKSSSSTCPPEPTKDVQCGNVYNSTATGEQVVVTLGGNLLCDENITQADGKKNAAVTLSGKDTVLNCQGYTISQTTVNINGIDTGSGAAVDCDIIPGPNESDRENMKKTCGLYFQYGVFLEDGATMVNCNVQKFLVGAEIENGGEIEDSEFSLTRRGVIINNRAANTMSKVVNG